MCRSAVLLLLALAVVREGQCQNARPGVGPTRALLARAESLWSGITRRDSASFYRLGLARGARRFDAGPLTVLLPGSVGTETGRRIASGAAQYVGGVIPSAFVASRVVVTYAATGVDLKLRAEALDGRTKVMADVRAEPDTFADGWVVAVALALDYRETRDSVWGGWLPLDLSLGWTLRRDGPAAVRELMRGDTRTGADCLAGGVAACRLWLGLDRDTAPYAVRYKPDELRRQIEATWFAWGSAVGVMRRCIAGSDDACVRAAALGAVAPIPAGPAPRGSVLAFVRSRRGPAPLERALADESGSVGDRLARAAGLPEDSLVQEWRIWLLTGGGQRRVTASVADALPVLMFGGLLLLAAAGSGRWR